jgi:hypothetical protein
VVCEAEEFWLLIELVDVENCEDFDEDFDEDIDDDTVDEPVELLLWEADEDTDDDAVDELVGLLLCEADEVFPLTELKESWEDPVCDFESVDE